MNNEWRQFYQSPFYTNEIGVYLFTKTRNIACTFLTNNVFFRKNIIEVLNGEKKGIFEASYQDQRIYINSTPVLRVRGWGWLTGIGAYNLPLEKAIKVQDSFGRWCADTLSGRI